MRALRDARVPPVDYGDGPRGSTDALGRHSGLPQARVSPPAMPAVSFPHERGNSSYHSRLTRGRVAGTSAVGGTRRARPKPLGGQKEARVFTAR